MEIQNFLLGLNSTILITLMFVFVAIMLFVILSGYNILGKRKGRAKTKKEVDREKEIAQQRNLYLHLLSFFERFCDGFGFKVNEVKIEKYKFLIGRLNITLPYIERNLRPKELIGFFKFVKFLSCFLAIVLFLLTNNKLCLILLALFFIDIFFEATMEGSIADEDKEIEEDFPDLFLLLYSRLIKGTNTRLAPVLDDYIRSIDTIDGDKSHMAIRKLVMTLRKNIELYGDDSLAIHNMRGIYRSAMVVNFMNLAVQSLKGVDNREKLLAFKMELSQKKLESMKEKAEKMVIKGQRVILLIYVILGEFVILSWVAKIGLTGGLSGIF